MIRIMIVAALLSAAATGLAKAGTVAEQRWQKRVVIVFAAAGDPRLAEQRRSLLADEAALVDRDLLAFAVVGAGLEPIHGEAPTGETAEGLRRRYGIADAAPFAAVLLGKDGGVKWRGERPIALANLNRLIDAMPMRRSGGR